MRVIVTRQNEDGTYDEVGMSNRFLKTYKSLKRAHKEAKSYSAGRKYRLEIFYGESIYGKPNKIEYGP